MADLTPPDRERCQGEFRSFMTLGPGYHRCENKAKYIATEKKAGKDGQKGSMSLCEECRAELVKRMPDLADIVLIEPTLEERKEALFKKARARYKPEDLDSFVHELKSQEAAGINNDGVDSQLEFMFDQGGEDWFTDVLGLKEKK